MKRGLIIMDYKNKHPYIFIHGMMGWGENEKMYAMPYWGMVCGNLMEQLRADGIEAYAPKVSPAGSAWDRACELYALLTGTTIDYGKAHSTEKGHNRFGRKYESALVKGWGQPMADGTIKKIHLLGHSFGGATMRMFAELMENGSAAERAVTPDDEISPLFQGGHGEWVKSITSISAPHDGTTFTHAFPKMMVGVTYAVLALGSIVGNTKATSVYDFHMEQWGLTAVPGNATNAANIFNLKAIKKIVKSKDNVFADLRIDQAMDMNKNIHTSPNTYYFSVAGNGTKPVGDGTFVRDKIMIFAFIPFAKKMGKFPLQNINGADVNESWRPNDGLVSLDSARYPHLEPHCVYEEVKGSPIKKGIWHVLPDAVADHGTVIGGSLSFIGHGKSAPFKNTYRYWLNVLENLPE